MNLQLRVSSKVFLTDSECWNWTGYVCEQYGYGYLSVDNKNTKAHKASYLAFKGPIPHGLSVCHTCDNRMCVNPDHLFLGTTADNIRDCVAKGRNARGEKQRNAVLTADQVREIRADAPNSRHKDIAKRYGVTSSAISAVATRRTWKHI